MEFMAEDLAEAGMVVSAVKVDAMVSWTQFYKNVPMALLIFIILFSGILTSEYAKGTLINVLTKGLSRWKVIAAKTISAAAVFRSSYAVLAGTGGVFLGLYLAGMFPKIGKFLPVKLMSFSGLLLSSGTPADFIPALAVAGLLMAVVVFNKKGI